MPIPATSTVFSPTTSATSSSSPAGRSRALQLRLPLVNGTTSAVTSSTSSSTPTSFKRSFEELFGGIEEDDDRVSGENDASVGNDSAIVGGGLRETGTSDRLRNGIGRNNKRQRSEICAAASLSPSSSSSSDSGSSSVFASPSASSDLSPQGISHDSRSYQHHSCPVIPAPSLPPRLPTPRLDDVQMSDIPLLDDDRPSITITATATGGQTVAALPTMATGRGRDAPDDSWLLRLPQLQRPGAAAEASYHSRSQQQRQSECIQVSTTNNCNQPPSMPPVLPAPTPRSRTPLPSLSLPSNVSTLPLIENLPSTTTAEVSEPHGPGMGASNTVSLNFRSSPPTPLLLSLSLPACASLGLDSESSVENTRQRATSTQSGSPSNRLRATIERYNEFESAIATLRRPISSVSPPLLGASSTRSDRDGGVPTMSLDTDSGHVRGRIQGRSQAQVSPPRLPPLELSVEEEDEVDELEDEEQLTNELDDQEYDDRRFVIAPTTISTGSIMNVYPHMARPVLSSSSSRVNNTGDVPPRLELELSGVSAGFGRNVIDENDEREGDDDETQRIASVSSTGPPPFRDRLDSALEALRSPSPLVPEFNTSIITATNDNITGNNNGGSDFATFGELLVEGLDQRRHLHPPHPVLSSGTATPSRRGRPSFASIAELVAHAHNHGEHHQTIEDAEAEAPSPTTASALTSGFTSVMDLIRASTARRRLGTREEEEEIAVPNRRSFSSSPQSQYLIPGAAISPGADSATLPVSTFFGRSGSVTQHQSNFRTSTSTSSRSNSTLNTHPSSDSNTSAAANTHDSNYLTAATALSYTPLPLSDPPLVDFTRLQPPILPPIVADTRIDDVETDHRSDNGSEGDEDEDREEEQRQSGLDGTARTSRLWQERFQTRTIGRENVQLPEVPSPSLSGFYEWLEGANVNAGMGSTSVNAPVSVATASLPGVAFTTEAVGAGVDDSEREGEASSSGRRHGQGSWEEDIFSGRMTADLGLNLAPRQQGRVNGQGVTTNTQTSLPQTNAAINENNVVEVDMESDAEREREVERLPWTLNVSAASLSSSRAIPSRSDFLRQEPREAQVQSSRRHPVYDPHSTGRNPVQSQRRWQRDGAYPLPSASTSISSLPTNTASGHSSSLFNSTPSPSSPPPSVQFLSSSSRRLPDFSTSSLSANGSASRPLLLSLGSDRRRPSFDSTRNPSNATGIGGTNADAATTPATDFTTNAWSEPTAAQVHIDSLSQLFVPPAPSPSLSVPPLPTLRLPQTFHSRGLQQTTPGWHAPLSERRSEDMITRARGNDPTVSFFSSRTGRTGIAGGLTARIGPDNSLAAENAAEARRRNAREDVLRRLSSRLGGSSSRDVPGFRSMERTGLFGGLALPPRNVHGQSARSGADAVGGSGSMGSNTTMSVHPGVLQPPPRPRLHFVRQTPIVEYENNSNHHSIENRRAFMIPQEAMIAGSRLPPHDTSTGPVMRLSTESDGDSRPENQSNPTEASIDSPSSDSSISVESFIDSGSGMSSASVYGGGEQLSTSSRTVFLDTELPSPGLGELFDSLGSNSAAATTTTVTRATESTQSLVGSSGPASAASSTTLYTSTFSGPPSAGRLTPSPVHTSDDDLEVRGIAHESLRPQSLTERLGHTRDETLDGMLQWDRDDESILSDEDSESPSAENVIRLHDRRPLPENLYHSDLSPIQVSATINNTGSTARAGASQETQNRIIDPSLFAPGPFRNTMENLATRAREYAAQEPSTRPSTSMSYPMGQFPTSSPLLPPPTYILSTASHPRQSGVTNAQLPPVIPPLSFEHNEITSSTNAEGLRSQAREPSSQQWITESDELLRSQQRMRDFLRFHQSGRAPTSILSSSTVSSAEQVSWERLPERPENTMGVHESGLGFRASEMHGTMANLDDALRVLRQDGRSTDQPVTFQGLSRQQRARGNTSNLGGREHERRVDNQERRTRYQDEALRSYARIWESETQRGRQREAGSNRNVPRWLHRNNLATPQPRMNLPSRLTVEGPFSARATNAPQHSISSRNNSNNGTNTDMNVQRLQAFLENTLDNESDLSDNDQNNLMAWVARHPRPTTSSASLSSASTTASTTATAGRNNENSRNGRFRRQANRLVGGVTSSSQIGNAAAENNGTGVGSRMFRGGMLRRLGTNSSNPSLETPTSDGTNGRRFVGGIARQLGNLEDYLDDDEFDASYESLLALQDALGEVKQRSTPEAVLRKLKKGKYREWAKEGTETRCPICLENYEMEDDVLKSGNCSHWMHRPCLETWFKKANTCPVCRMDVEPRPPTSASRGRYGRIPRSDRWRNAGTSNRNNGPSSINTASEGASGRFVRTTEATAAGPNRSSISTRSNGTGNERSIASSMRISGSRDSVDFNSSGRNMGRPF